MRDLGSFQLMAYEFLKKEMNVLKGADISAKLVCTVDHHEKKEILNVTNYMWSYSLQNTPEYLASSAGAKIFAGLLTYPYYQVIRARLQDQHKDYKGFFDVVQKTWKYVVVVFNINRLTCFRRAKL